MPLHTITKLRAYLALEGLGPTLVRALSGSAGIRIIGMSFGFLVGIQLARGLGAAGYGVYGLAMSAISLISIPTELGLPQLVTREVAAAQVRSDGALIHGILRWANQTIVLLSVCMSAAGLTIWLIFNERISGSVAMALLVGLPLVPLVPLGNLRGGALRGMQKIITGQLPEVVLRPALFSLLLFIATLMFPSGLSPAIAMAMQVAAAAITFAVVSKILSSALPKTPPIHISRSQTNAWISSAVPMALTEGMRILSGNLSILLLGLLSTAEVVGVFRVATSMSVLMVMPISLVHVVSGPIISRLFTSDNHEQLKKMMGFLAIAMVLGVTILTLPFLLVGSMLMTSVFGAEFGDSNIPLLILSGGTIIGSAFGATATLLNMTGNERRVTRSFGFSLLVLALTSLPFIYFWGAIGAALANSIAFIFWSVLMWRDASKLLRMDASIAAFFRSALGFRL